MTAHIVPKSHLGQASVLFIVVMPIFFSIGMSFVDHYGSTSSGETISQDIMVRPGIALPMLAGFLSGIAAFIAGIVSIGRKKERSILVFVATAIGFLVVLWCLVEVLFPHSNP